MTLRYILVILSIGCSGFLNAQYYRVFFSDKGENIGADFYQTPVPVRYIDEVKLHCDSVWMISNWLNYALIESEKDISTLQQLPFVDHVEKIHSTQSVSLQLNEYSWLEKDSLDPVELDEHRQWQLDTLGYSFFRGKNIRGKGIVVAIIDAGFTKADESNAFKEIFATNRVLKTWDFLDNDTNVYHGSTHGTSVWGCIAGTLDGKSTGLATEASFILLRSEDQQTETMADEDRWIQAIEKAYEWGADIDNSSVGFTDVLHSRDQVNGQSLISQAAEIATQKGMLVVVAGGNELVTIWRTLAIPADAEGVIAVGAIDRHGYQTYFSSVGPTADGRAKPDVVAPGTCAIVKGNDLVLGNGTSFAAPLVTGYLACMMELKGKKNFIKDSLKYYGGLYPYFDYVFGYGVPGIVARDSSLGYSYGLNKELRNFHIAGSEVAAQDEVCFNIRLKIVGEDGKIKFSRYYKKITGGKLKVPIGAKQPFNYTKYYDEQPTDKWCIWWDGQYFEF